MKLFFGPDVTYNPVGRITYPFSFQINRKNVGTLTYNSSSAGYDAVFKSYQDLKKKINPVDPTFGVLTSALRTPTGEIVLQEKVVYSTIDNNGSLYTVKIYKEPERTTLLDTKENLSLNDARNLKINPADYESTAIVEYTFGLDGSTCFFKESKIII